ncbi:MAG: hypothetical protein U0M60_14940, partial [Clostridia bacterium]|nr:hypothetical protein [Clostridia bacterium]
VIDNLSKSVPERLLINAVTFHRKYIIVFKRCHRNPAAPFYCILGEVIVLLRFYTIVITDFTACNYNKDVAMKQV